MVIVIVFETWGVRSLNLDAKFLQNNCQLQCFFFFRRISSFNEELYHVIANKQKSLNSYL
jgi:hypothetical protein